MAEELQEIEHKSDNFRPNPDMDEKLARLEAEARHYSNLRPLDFIFLGFILLGIVFAFTGQSFLESMGLTDTYFSKYAPLIGIGTSIYFSILFSYLLAIRSSNKQQLNQELEALKIKQRVFNISLDESEPLSYFDRLVNINITNLDAYYSMVKGHTNNSFIASISVGVIGFILIVTGLLIAFTDVNNATTIAYISSGSGIVTEFISGVFFYLYNKTTQQLKEYHDSLVEIQNILLSFKIIEDLDIDDQKADIAKTMIEALVKRSS